MHDNLTDGGMVTGVTGLLCFLCFDWCY